MQDLANWQPLDRPDHPVYLEILGEIGALAESGRTKQARGYFRQICEADFPFYMLHCHSFGQYLCAEPGHKHYGKPWMTHPWVWDWSCRLQEEFVTGESGVLHLRPRYHYKTGILTCGGTNWEVNRNRKVTVAIISWKYEDTGHKIYGAIRSEMESNKLQRQHWPHIYTAESIARYTNRQLTVDRPLGPKEPTVSIHGIDSLPDSQHYNWVIVDDAVVRATVKTPDSIRNTYAAMQGMSALCDQRPRLTWIGTRWKLNDPYELGINDGKFSRVDFSSCYHGDGATPVLHTKEFLAYHRAEMGVYEFSAHFLGKPTPDAQQRLERGWLGSYSRKEDGQHPAVGKRRYLILDPAEGGENSGLAAATDLAFGGDQKIRIIDLWREKWGIVEMVQKTFDMVKLARGQGAPYAKVWLDGYTGSKPYYDAIMERQRREDFQFPVGRLPAPGGKESKDERIAYLVAPMEVGRYLIPDDERFGHASDHSTDDTCQQFLKQEYDLWSPAGSIGDVTSLDTLAWTAHPETRNKFRFPEVVGPTYQLGYFGHPKAADRNKSHHGMPAGVSPWVF